MSDAHASPKNSDQPQDQQSVIENAGTVGFWTIASRVLGLYRFRLMAQIFGATGVADAFNFAFVFPNLTRRLFGEGALSSAFVPVFSGQLAKGEKEAANRTASVLLCRLFYWLSLGCIVVIALAAGARLALPWALSTFPTLFTRWATGDLLLEIQLIQWLLPYLVFINLSAVLMGILNSLGHFRIPAFAPVLLNIFMIAACWMVKGTSQPSQAIWYVAYAVLAGGVAQLLIQVPPALARGFRYHPTASPSDPGYQEVMANFKPVVLLVAVFQINVMLDNIIAQIFIPESGPVTYLNMGTSIYQLPFSIIALALGTAALPLLSAYWAQQRTQDFVKTLLTGIRLNIFLAIPCTVGIVLLAVDIVRLLYGTGRFLENNAEPVYRTAGVAIYSTLGLVFFSVNAMLARGLYAMKDMRTPTSTSAWSVAINLAFNLIFVVGWPALARVLDPYRMTSPSDPSTAHYVIEVLCAPASLKESGIALASTISNGWQTWMLWKVVRQRLEERSVQAPRVERMLGRLLSAAAISVIAGYIGYRQFAGKPEWEGFWAFFGAALGAIVPFWLLGKQYFIAQLKDAPQEDARYRYGVREEFWSDELKFEYALYSTAMASAIMGFLVWAVRDSLPPEGNFIAVLQRAIVPVVAGVLVYQSAASGMMSREYEEVWAALTRKFRRK
ncbi:MAG TPA: murein biosynthesis integral membrane protein MurJ [Planctomycetota bacterium]|jgi:putative peptidoglycan lipid II flippase